MQWRRIGFYTKFIARAYEPGKLTRNSHGPCRARRRRAASTDGHNETYERSSLSCLPRPSSRPRVTPFVLRLCIHCTSTGQLASSSLQMFLNWASVRRHCHWPLQNCLLVGANVPVHVPVTGTLRPGPGLGLPSGGPGRRYHGRRGRRGGARA